MSLFTQKFFRAMWFVATVAAAAGAAACANQGEPGHVLDEAMRAHRTAAVVSGGRRRLLPRHGRRRCRSRREEIQGRNMWLVWTGGNDRFWDVHLGDELRHARLPEDGVVAPDDARYGRDTRWTYLGLVNEPCFKKATGPDPNRYGLWLDVRDPACPPDPFANDDKYPGVADRRARQDRRRSARTTASRPASSACGSFRIRRSTRTRSKKWDSERYYRDPELLLLERPREAVSRRHVVRVLPRRSESRSSRRPIPRTRAGRT